MRIVYFDNAANWPLVVYPAEGVSVFANTVQQGDNVVGEYSGSPDNGLNVGLHEYLGEWPIPEAPTPIQTAGYRLFNPLVGFTGAEQELLAASVDPDVKAAYAALRLYPTIDFADPEVVAMFDLFVTDGAISEQRKDGLAGADI